ncbi:MAG: substrate-binding domain-containing protein [Actinomyces sp.]|nr:substrate-binding domain-containing protein [Actinomyces sp.]MCI1642508.1 substrate-binding domain-containing protein [Actinomyces sp.]MCI1663059.1 substrate-binding domain-containing protein [Actinomyces sp.]MCI1691697.1 substrate-binding domain-containing protein [Actinomyces sp.]MCI1788636.1 substrate-binding domain-containing protein [Actinomyces sp.]MCI1829738.1 substrate-binding domain-containing protein [Actinomyces sp.]
MTRISRRRVPGLAFASVAALTLVGCSTVASESGSADESGADAASGTSGAEQSWAADAPSLEGKTIGVAVVGTQHFWDREAFEGAVNEVERLGGTVITTDGGRDNTVHAENHDTFLTAGVDAVITILGDDAVEPKLKALQDADIPVFGVDHASDYVVNNTQSDSVIGGTQIGDVTADYFESQDITAPKIAVFNAFSETLSYCGDRYDAWRAELKKRLPDTEFLTPELAEQFSSPAEDTRQQTLSLLESHPEGTIDGIHVACWDQPAIGAVQAIEDSGRDDVVVTAFDAGPDTLEIQEEDGSPLVGNVAQQPRLIGTTSADNAARYLAGEDVEKDTYVETFPVLGQDGAATVYEQLGYDQ